MDSIFEDREHVSLQNQVNSPLLRLPAELRERIYEYASARHCLNIGRLATWGQLQAQVRPDSLLSSCRQIRFEAAPFFAGRTIFSTESPKDILCALGDSIRQFTSLSICLDKLINFLQAANVHKVDLSNIQHVEIRNAIPTGTSAGPLSGILTAFVREELKGTDVEVTYA
ncbi:hypothetical protein CFE70_007371 [Pyrenophora teres f. teres 0-1]|uniref:Uncharacterized protein n=1 Tax=Pyrenophora teres f. teres (strain 0-1) TaxID=861557 RepID=E3RPA6_PYRTT|nr:hypothetical protein PTT_10460 [Pyrenophora teres f. teres 0-1]KAK1908765.1 hypothetical protein P3342_009616 [Pyrenophora teres f. teres]